MKIKEKRKGKENPKTGKPYSVKFKRRVVASYRSGMYDEATIEEKFKISRKLLWQWNKWYYDHFLSHYYRSPNYGKGKIPKGAEQTTHSATTGDERRAKARADEESWNGATFTDCRSGPQNKSKKKWKKAVDALRKDYPESSLTELCSV